MSIDQYIKDAIRTERIPSFEITVPEHVFKLADVDKGEVIVHVPGRAGRFDGVLGTVQARLLHSALGMSTEISEVMAAIRANDDVNIIEELGDVMWYWAIGMDVVGLTMLAGLHRGMPVGRFDGVLLMEAICDWADIVRRHVIHGKAWDIDNAKEALLEIHHQVGLLARAHGSDSRTVMEKNIAKLRVRFPEKYDSGRFENRNLEAERTALETSPCALHNGLQEIHGMNGPDRRANEFLERLRAGKQCTCRDPVPEIERETGSPIRDGAQEIAQQQEVGPGMQQGIGRCICYSTGGELMPHLYGTCPAHPER